MLIFDHHTGDIDIDGRFVKRPPLAEFGAIYGDALNCLRSALDHITWGLSVRYQARIGAPGPPPHPIPHSSPWKSVGFPIVMHAHHWKDALTKKLRLIDPALHSRFYDLQPFAVNPTTPQQAWLAMLDLLWNIDKHHVVHIGNLTVSLERLAVARRSDGVPLPGEYRSFGAQPIDLNAFDAEAHLGRITDTTFNAWPDSANEVQMDRFVGVNLFFDQGVPGLGMNMEFALGHMHNAVVLVADAFEPEFT